MGTEILNPQDCLIERPRIIGGGGGGSRWRSHRKRGAQSVFSKNTTITTTTTTNNSINNNLVLGQVVILKRGESLDLKRKTENSVKRTVSDSIPKQIRIRDRTSSGDEYAGTAFFLSPSPRALPLPSFSKKTQAAECAVAVHDSATKDLRRLLRLD
ncbi:hypothetical protein Scep_030532 [Stephania cephalantha]|uniref:Uncharacterized protein n=1 Tax=Stephania cephalantha TaxID=152367 RepID=A0AAP0HH03_9MAGN